MPSQHLVPAFATSLGLSPRAQANALKALALVGEEPTHQPEWGPRAAAALIIGANWAGEKRTPSEVAEATHVPEQAVAKHYALMAERLKRISP